VGIQLAVRPNMASAASTRAARHVRVAPDESALLTGVRGFVRENSLSLVLGSVFVALLVLQIVTGFREFNHEIVEHGGRPIHYRGYLTSGHFLEATAENWESEFLQMGFYVFLTIFLRQKGSSESKKLEGKAEVDKDPRLERHKPDAPMPVRRGGFILKIYENSLTLAFAALFLVSFLLHGVGGAAEYSRDQVAHGNATAGTLEYMTSSRFWFESFQNWQSEFLAVLSIVLLSIYLRQRGSPESKPVAAAHAETP
jgi:hypothetical protein